MVLNFIRDSQGRFIANSFSHLPSEGVELVVELIPYKNDTAIMKIIPQAEGLEISAKESIDILEQTDKLIQEQANNIFKE